MAEYLPFADKHSIQEVQISLVFPSNFEQQAIATARGVAQAQLSESLPRSAEVISGAIQIDLLNPDEPVQRNISSSSAGFQFAKVQGNAQPAQTVALTGNVFSLSFFEYESWIQTRKDADLYASTIISALPLIQNPVIAFGLRFIDRYTFNGLPEQAAARLLMNPKSPYTAPQIFDAGSAWHCNTGWFEDDTDDRILHNLNIASNLVDLSSTVTIDHQATVHLGAPRQSPQSLFTPPSGQTALTTALDDLHQRNKEILQEVLLPEMLEKIGLTP